MKVLFENVVLESLDYVLPEEVLTSEELEKRLSSLYERLRLPYGRLELMTGIKERRLWPTGIRPSDFSLKAGQKVFGHSSQSPDEIDVLIHASVCRDALEPASAMRVHQGLGLSPECLAFDVSNACLGVLNAWILLGKMIEKGQIRSGMVVAGENAGPLVEKTLQFLAGDSAKNQIDRQSFKKFFANLTIGSGAFACVLTHRKRSPHSPRLLGGTILTHSHHHQLCEGGGDIHSLQMETDSEKLLQAGIELAAKNWELTKLALGWSNQTPQHVITHQVGRMHQHLLYDSLKLDISKDFSTYPLLGNTGSVALPITLAQGRDKGLFQAGDLLALLGIGSGLNSMMLGVEWNLQKDHPR